MNQYAQALAELQTRPDHELKQIGDQWQTPKPLAWGLFSHFSPMLGPVVLDMFADDCNHLVPNYYTAAGNALTQDMAADLRRLGGAAFGNPPYSRPCADSDGSPITGMENILTFCRKQREQGAKIMLLIKAATSETWWPEDADFIQFISGRIGFEVPEWYVPRDPKKDKPSSSGFASAVVIFDASWQGERRPEARLRRDALITAGHQVILDMQEKPQLRYGSVCSGVEAASLAWEHLGWKPAWFAEIESFPSAVLAHRWPLVTNLGDMTKIATTILNKDVVAPDILVGGTPCQAFSVAGARQGLADDRGFLTIKYVELANAIDQQRASAGLEPCITVWENVPGVLSSKDNAFGAFLGFLAGEDCELVPPGKKWENAGCVLGPQRAIAWRILDAQYFGVAQRRRRVFVVASARKGFDPAKVLFECEGVRRDSAPSREAGKAVAALTANGVGTCCADDNQGQAGHLIPAACFRMVAFGEYDDDGTASSMKARDYKDATDLAVMTVHGTQDPDTNIELAHTLGRNHGQENAVLVKGVRRLTPVECERLQGFPDNHTLIPWAAYQKTMRKAESGMPITATESEVLAARIAALYEPGLRDQSTENCPDGPRYKAIGNSMTVPCMSFIGERIAQALSGNL